jgi:hypothetical protein
MAARRGSGQDPPFDIAPIRAYTGRKHPPVRFERLPTSGGLRMNRRCLAARRALAASAVAMSLTPISLAGQGPARTAAVPSKDWTPPRTPDGQPELQGVWDYRTITPMQRPAALGNKQFFTADEAAKFEEQENRRQNRDLIDPKKGGGQYLPGSVIPYNEFWYERGSRIVGSKRTSLIVDPPDGRIPRMTPEAAKRLDDQAAAARDEQLGVVRADSPESRSLASFQSMAARICLRASASTRATRAADGRAARS